MVQSIDDARRRQRATGARTPPHDLPAEESLLGAMLISRDAVAVALEQCQTSDFYKPAHGHVFDAITSLYAQGEPVDPVTVADELHRSGLLDLVGGPSGLISLQAATPSTSNAARYARIVSDHALLRRLIGVAGEIADLGYDVPEDVDAAVDRAESMVFDVGQRRVAETLAPLRDLLSASLDRLEALYDRGESITGVPTGYTDLDEQLSGLQPSNLVIVGARPSAGKTSLALGMAANAAMEAHHPVLFFSLEMSHLEITQRLLCAEARVDASRMRNGRLHDTDWSKISHAIGRLGEAPIFIDDNPNLTIMDIRAKARRLKSREGLGLVVIDYLQLMSGRSSAENRQVEVSEISRGLKILARELEVPVVALSQLSRNLEQRADKRPMLADLRESGCMTADTRVWRADTGEEVSFGELLLTGQTDVPVWSLDRDLKMVPARMTKVFETGIKPVFELRLRSGHRVKASPNHPFLTLDGWRRLDELKAADRLAVPRQVPEPLEPHRLPEAEVVMLAHLLGDGCVAPRQSVHYTSADLANIEAVEQAAGLSHLRSYDKFVPRPVFRLPNDQLALFFRHLWSTDGSISIDRHRGQVRLYYASTSRRLVDDLQRLLLRFGITSRVKAVSKSGYRPGYHLHVYGQVNQRRFLEDVGIFGARGAKVPEALGFLAQRAVNTNVDTVPREVWSRVKRAMASTGVTARALAAGLGTAYCGSTLYKHAPSRGRLVRVATLVADPVLEAIARSDVFWDEVEAIEYLGEEPVYDATVDETHNFIADGIVAENSLEQDADVVMFIYRDEVYNPESTDRGTAEIIVAKHRNGPTGTARLAFLEHYARFANMARGV